MKNIKKSLLGALFVGTSIAFNNTSYAFGGLFPMVQQKQNTAYHTQTQNLPNTPNLPTQAYGGTTEEESRFLNLVADIEFFNVLAALIKQNHLILDRVPYSAEDNWPEILVAFKEGKGLNEQLETQYENCLDNLLKKDFPLYSILPKAPMTFSLTGFLRKIQEQIIKKVGTNLEHTKVVLLYKEGNCLCPAYSKLFNINVDSKACSIEKKECETYYKTPLENLVTKYFFQEKRDENTSWEEMEIPQSCTRPVKGYIYANFKEAFYSLLPRDRVTKVRELEEKILNLQNEISLLKAKIEAEKKKMESSQNAAKNKEMQQKIATWEKELKNKEKVRDTLSAERNKLYKELMNSIEYPIDKELREENIKLAKNLLKAVKYIHSLNNEVVALNTVNLMKTVYDLYQAATAPGATLRGAMIVSAKYGFKNKEYLQGIVKNILVFIPQALSTYYYLIAQNNFIEPYENYLKVYIELSKKLEK